MRTHLVFFRPLLLSLRVLPTQSSSHTLPPAHAMTIIEVHLFSRNSSALHRFDSCSKSDLSTTAVCALVGIPPQSLLFTTFLVSTAPYLSLTRQNSPRTTIDVTAYRYAHHLESYLSLLPPYPPNQAVNIRPCLSPSNLPTPLLFVALAPPATLSPIACSLLTLLFCVHNHAMSFLVSTRRPSRIARHSLFSVERCTRPTVSPGEIANSRQL